MNNPHFWQPARPVPLQIGPNGNVVNHGDNGFSQYAEVAARFHASLVLNHTEGNAARIAFDHADAFFAELAARTQS